MVAGRPARHHALQPGPFRAGVHLGSPRLNASPFFARTASPPPWLLGVLVIALVAGLLLAFLQVLKSSVADGAQRRQTVLSQQDAQWQCSRLAQRQARADCRAGLLDATASPAQP